MATTITSKDLVKDKKLETIKPEADPILTAGQGIIDSAISGVTNAQSEVDKLNKAQADNLENLLELNKELGGKAAYSAEQLKIAGVDTEKANFDRYSQELNDITASIKGLSRKADAIPLEMQEKFKGTGATDVGVAPFTASALRKNAIEALTKASLADIVTANINNSVIRYNAALDKANQAIDLKYEPIETEIANLKEQLALNKEYLITPAEKKLAEKQSVILAERERKMKEEKENEKAVNELFVQAAKNKAPQNVLNKIRSSKNIMEAAGAAGEYLTSPLEKLQLEKLRMDINESKAKLEAVSGTSAKETKIDATKSLKTLITELKTTSGMKGAVGFGWSKLIPGFLKGGSDKFIAGTQAANYAATFNQLKDTLAMANIEKLKGAMSDKDLEFLRNTATKLSLSQSETAFLTELNKLDVKMNEVLEKNGIDPNSINTYSGVDNNALINMASTNALTNNQFFNR